MARWSNIALKNCKPAGFAGFSGRFILIGKFLYALQVLIDLKPAKPVCRLSRLSILAANLIACSMLRNFRINEKATLKPAKPATSVIL